MISAGKLPTPIFAPPGVIPVGAVITLTGKHKLSWLRRRLGTRLIVLSAFLLKADVRIWTTFKQSPAEGSAE